MKIKEVTFSYKRGLPNFSSVTTFLTATIEPNDKLDEVWDYIKKECIRQANLDQSWLNQKEGEK